MNRTEIHLHWTVDPPVSLHVVCQQRVLTAQELHTLADVVSTIEDFRADMQGTRDLVGNE